MTWPPGKECVAPDQVRGVAQLKVALRDAVGEGLEVREACVGDRLAGERPKTFGGLSILGLMDLLK